MHNVLDVIQAWENRRWVDPNMIARVMEVHPRTVRNWFHSGRTCLEVFQICPGMPLRFTAESAIRLLRTGITLKTMTE